jgi:hypothetical protein
MAESEEGEHAVLHFMLSGERVKTPVLVVEQLE